MNDIKEQILADAIESYVESEMKIKALQYALAGVGIICITLVAVIISIV